MNNNKQMLCASPRMGLAFCVHLLRTRKLCTSYLKLSHSALEAFFPFVQVRELRFLEVCLLPKISLSVKDEKDGGRFESEAQGLSKHSMPLPFPDQIS